MMRMPDEPTTPEQWQVIAWGSIVIFLLVGAIGLVFSLNPPEDKVELAITLRWYSFTFFALAAAIYVAKRGIEYYLKNI